ncbi:MAG TPA: PilZ domain-containing protein [Pyrinomonadaceae bacterium]|jgi:hypothetical protein|nr:PilZ domain-containing protein [Pyrinomonadaceae bacterium]
MEEGQKSKRIRERLELQLPVRVYCRESLDQEWIEMSRLSDVTPFGTRFAIGHPVEVGRLLHLTLPMPRQLRCFDHVEDQYRVWSLIRHTRGLRSQTGEIIPRFEVGVAFIGKRAPASYDLDPTTRYEVAASPTEAGLWSLQEQSDETAEYSPSSDPRPETRHNIPVEVVVEAFDEKGKVSATEQTVTENISRRGAAIFTTLNLARGRFVRVTSAQYQISVLAVVRANRAGADKMTRLHVEFMGQQWPLEGIE